MYSDIFDFPLKAWEIHKWLVSKKGDLKDIEKALDQKRLQKLVKSSQGYYFLSSRRGLSKKRFQRKKVSENFLKQAKFVASIFRLIPWVKLVGVSGSLAVENASLHDDIDFFIITQKKRLWFSRILLLLLTELLGKRREKQESSSQSAGKICINLLLEEDNLAQLNRDIYIAHEILQMRVLWQRDGIYSKFLEDNLWVFDFLPNWLSGQTIEKGNIKKVKSHNKNHKKDKKEQKLAASLLDLIENATKFLQLRYMGLPKGRERIESGALYFHPEDCRERILEQYRIRLKRLSQDV